MKKSIWMLLGFVLISTSLFSQRDETVFGRTGLRLSGAWGGSLVNVASIGDDISVFSGGYGGIEFNKTVFIGWAGYGLNDDIQIGDETRDLDMYYNGPIVSFTPRAWKVVHPKINFMAGGGNMRFNNSTRDRIGVFQPSAGLEVNIFRWFRIGGEVGYRAVTDVKDGFATNKDMSGIFGEV